MNKLSINDIVKIVEDVSSACNSLESYMTTSKIETPDNGYIKNVLSMFPAYYKAKKIAEKRLWLTRYSTEKIIKKFDDENQFELKGLPYQDIIDIVERSLSKIVSRLYCSDIFYITTSKNDIINKIEGPIKKMSSDLNEFLKVLICKSITNLQYLARHGASQPIKLLIDDIITKFYQLGTGLNMSNDIIRNLPDYCKLIFEITYNKENKNNGFLLSIRPLDIVA